MEIEKQRDYILVRDGDNPKSALLTKLTGSKADNPKVIMSTGSNVYLYFKSNLGDSKRGFKVRYAQGEYERPLIRVLF